MARRDRSRKLSTPEAILDALPAKLRYPQPQDFTQATDWTTRGTEAMWNHWQALRAWCREHKVDPVLAGDATTQIRSRLARAAAGGRGPFEA